MPRILSFEREVHATLELLPLGVRRKLDLAGIKLSLEGWQAMPLGDRRALVDTEVDDDASAFAAALRAAAERAGVTLRPLPERGPPPWRVPSVPAALCARLDELGQRLDDATWSALDDEARYVLLHLSGQRREQGAGPRAELGAAMVELGLTPV